MTPDTIVEARVSESSSSQSSSTWERLEGLACRVEANVERWALTWAAVLSIIYLSTVLAVSWTRILSFDELLTFWFCRFKSLSHLWWMLKSPVEGIPPLFYLITRASEALAGENAIALRVPGMVGYWVMSVTVYKLARRHTSALFAVVAAIFPCVTLAFYYASEARPYGMLLACSALLLWFWLEAVEAVGRWRMRAIIAMAVVMALAASIHYYAGLIAVPLAAGELARLIERRKPDWLVWIAVVAGAAAELVYVPLIRGFLHAHKTAYVWNKPHVDFLWKSYTTILGVTSLPVVIVLGWLLIRWKSEASAGAQNQRLLPRHESAAYVSLVLVPLVGYVAAQRVVGMLTERYVIETVIGFSILFALGAAKMSSNRRSVGLALLSLALVSFVVLQFQNLRREYQERGRFQHFDSEAVARSLNLSVTTEHIGDMLAMDYYGPRGFSSRFVIAVDPQIARDYGIPDSTPKIYLGSQGILPVHVERFTDFLEHNDQFLIFGGPLDWMADYVMKRGARVEIVLQTDRELLLLVTQHPHAGQEARSAQVRTVSKPF